MEAPLLNKVSESGLITLDLEKVIEIKSPVSFDLAPFLFMGMILREKDFRAALQQHEWEQYRDLPVAVFCSADAIIPAWAYMLVMVRLGGLASEIYCGSQDDMKKQLLIREIDKLPMDPYDQKRVVVKGCGNKSIGEFAYLEITKKLLPVAKSIMYGEPCSTVPVFKRKE